MPAAILIPLFVAGAATAIGLGIKASRTTTKSTYNGTVEPDATPVAEPIPQPAAPQAVPAISPPVVQSQAASAAQRMRRRATAGESGRVTTGAPTLLQQQIGTAGAPRTLIGRS